MDSEVVKVITGVATAIIGLAILSVILSNKANTLGLVQNLSSGLAQDIQAATGPVTGGIVGQPQFAASTGYA